MTGPFWENRSPFEWFAFARAPWQFCHLSPTLTMGSLPPPCKLFSGRRQPALYSSAMASNSQVLLHLLHFNIFLLCVGFCVGAAEAPPPLPAMVIFQAGTQQRERFCVYCHEVPCLSLFKAAQGTSGCTLSWHSTSASHTQTHLGLPGLRSV